MKKMFTKRKLLGRTGNDGLIFKIVLYILFIGISFIFLYPILQMTVTSFMPLVDLIDPTTIWIPKNFTFENYLRAINALKFWRSLKDSFIVSIIPTIFVVFSSAFIGYGFASFDFPFKKTLMVVLLAIFLIPNILMSIPTYVIYRRLNLISSLKTYIYPALLGFGIRQTIFILIFYQFFKMIPEELKEAAEMDGAHAFKIFTHVAIPMSMPAFLITSLYSFVWYWNETSLPLKYFQKNDGTFSFTTLPMAVRDFVRVYRELYPTGTVGLEGASETFNQGVQFAGTMLSILPLLIVFFISQKWFIESVDRSGIAGS
jgi:multiple sugar transport system permease protein